MITPDCHGAPNRNNIPRAKKFPTWGWAKAGHRRELVECGIPKSAPAAHNMARGYHLPVRSFLTQTRETALQLSKSKLA